MDLINTFTTATKGYVNWLIEDQILVAGRSLYENYFWTLLLISIFFFVLELAIPWRKNQAVFRKDFWLDFFYMYFNFFLFYIILFAGLEEVGSSLSAKFFTAIGIEKVGWLNIKGWPQGVQVLVVFIFTDFTHWNIHRMLHKFEFLWRFHRLHHSVKEMGFAAHLRFHWMESILYKVVTYFALLVIGFEVETLFYMHILTITWGHYNHANVNLPIGPLKYIFNNPQMHMWHHVKKLPKGKSLGVNFGLTLSVWDYLFNTAYEPKSSRDIELGFDGDEQYPKTFWKQVVSGFRKN